MVNALMTTASNTPTDTPMEDDAVAAPGAASIRSTASIRRPGGAWEWHQASVLLHDFAEWILAAGGIDVMTEQPGFASELDDLAAVYDGGGADMFVAFDDGLAVGTVAVRYHVDRTAELKRMYVRRAARGHGVADQLVAHVVAGASARGCRAVWLETLQGAMDPAIRLYRRHGFVPSARRGTLTNGGVVVMERQVV